MKKIGIYIITNLTAIWIICLILTGVKITNGFISYLLFSIVVSLINWGVKPIVRFLTLPINFVTYGIFNLLLNISLFFILKYIVPGFEISSGEFVGIKTPFFVIPSWHVDATVTIIIGAIILSLMASLVDWLLKN